MTYESSDGRRFVLSFATPEEWAETTRSQLLRLGCSEEYAERRAELIRTAKSV